MKLFRRRTRFFALLLATLQFSQHFAQEVRPEPRPTIEKIVIRHVGPQEVSDELIQANIRVRVGDPYSRVSVDDDVQTLHATGYFYNVRVFEEVTSFETDAQGTPVRDPLGRAIPKQFTLTYVVQGKPLLTEIRFSGNHKYSDTKLRNKLTSKVGEPLSEQKLFTDSQEILKMYQKAGLAKTKVEYKPIINEELGRGTVTFEITEAPKVLLKDVVFENAHAFTQKKLRKTIKTRRHWMFSWITGSGKFKDDQFEDDRQTLKEFYADHGYIDYEMKNFELDPTSKTNRVVLRMDLDEGIQYKVGTVQFKGNEIYTGQEIKTLAVRLNTPQGEKGATGLRLQEASVFSPQDLARDVEGVTDLYGARGYIDATVIPQKNANIETGTIDLLYNIKEGDKAYVEKIEIRGNSKTKDKVIRRELAITPGETFDMVKVKVSKSILEQMQYFEKIEATPEPSDAGPNRKNLIIAVQEKNTGNIAVGAGFSSVDSIVGFIEVSQGNFDLFNPPYFTGGGQKARLRAQYGTERQDYVATFIEPWFLGRRLELNIELYHRELNYLSDNYDETITGARIGLRRALPRHFEVGAAYQIQNVDLTFSPSYIAENPLNPILLQAGKTLISQVTPMVAHDTRNNYLLPTRGHRVELLTAIAGGVLGGDADFYKLELRGAQYLSPVEIFKMTGRRADFFQGHILELIGRIGVADWFGNGDRGLPDVPLFERYFLGGLYNLRGFKYRKVGPRDFAPNVNENGEIEYIPNGEPLGGDTYWFASAEYSIPVIERVRFAMFYDVGMVYASPYSFSTEQPITGRDYQTGLYNSDFGFGLRLNLPIGPLRLDYAIPMKTGVYNEGHGRFQFGVGYTRDF